MATKKEDAISIIEVRTGTVEVCILGTTPQIHQRMSQKAQHELLLPKGRKNAAERASTLKHNPMEEFAASAYRTTDERAPTELAMPATAWKAAIRSAALDLPGASKAQLGRLMWVEGEMIPVWGVPKIFLSVTRSADAARTPDIRSRLIIPKWATKISVTYIKPILNEQAIVNLIAAAGLTIGMSDWRPQKGSGNYGQFKIVPPDDLEFVAVCRAGTRKPQLEAIAAPEAYNDETAEMLAWFDVEIKRRGFKIAA